MTIHILGLEDEVLRLSDGKHSEIITEDHPTFTLAKGEHTFAVEQIATAPHKPKSGWGMYLLGQILTAIPRAVAMRKPIVQRCNPILLTANITVNPGRYDEFTLFFAPGGYNREINTFLPPKLEGDAQISIEMGRYALDDANIKRAIREETLSKAGYCVNLIAFPFFFFILFFLWLYRVLFYIFASNLPFMLLVCCLLQLHSRKVKRDLREKVAGTLRHLNGDP